MLQHQIQLQTIPLDAKYYGYGSTNLPSLSFLLVSLQVLLLDSDLLPDLWQDEMSGALKREDHQQLAFSYNYNYQPQTQQNQQQSQIFAAPASTQRPYLLSQSPIWNDMYLDSSKEVDVNRLLPNNLACELDTPPRKNSNFSDHLEDGLFEFEHHHLHPTSTSTSSINTSHNNSICSIENVTTTILNTPTLSHQNNASHCHHSKHKHQPVNTQLYKTELCALFVKMGVCPYGNKCQFAHGEQELKKIERPPKWRSKPCANWAKYGSCRYGNRCCFKHGN